MSELVAITDSDPSDREAYHDIDGDGEVVCSAGSDERTTFLVVSRSEVTDGLDRCRHCAGDVDWSPGQGSELAAKLAAADPNEVVGE